MDRRGFLAALAAALVQAGPGLAADDYVTEIVRQLERQGYDTVTVSRTLLGRVKIVATGRRGRREIIVNPSTGEILRDLREREGRDSGILGDDDDDDDDGIDDDEDDDHGGDDDDKDDDDNSGPGGGGDDDDGGHDG